MTRTFMHVNVSNSPQVNKKVLLPMTPDVHFLSSYNSIDLRGFLFHFGAGTVLFFRRGTGHDWSLKMVY